MLVNGDAWKSTTPYFQALTQKASGSFEVCPQLSLNLPMNKTYDAQQFKWKNEFEFIDKILTESGSRTACSWHVALFEECIPTNIAAV